MMQIQMYLDVEDTGQARDYLQGRLRSRLVAGHRFYAAFYTVKCNLGYYSVSDIGAYFDDGSIDSTHLFGWTQSQYTPQVVDTNIISDTLNWIKVEGTFVANGTESFVTIGNFTPYDQVHVSPPLGRYSTFSWYLIDDVSVIDCNNTPDGGPNVTVNQGDTIQLGPTEHLLPYTWYQQGSGVPIASGSGISVHPTVTTTYILEQDLCGVKSYDTIVVRVHTLGIEAEPASLSGIRLSPNPAISMVTITGATQCDVTICNIAGSVLLQCSPTTPTETIDLSNLPAGLYTVLLRNPGTGERSVRKLVKE